MIHPAFVAQQRDRWLRCDAARWVRPDAAKFLKPGTDPADVYPALARQRDRERDMARHAYDREIDAVLVRERAVLDGLRRELAQVKSDLAWRRLRDAIAQKYSATQPRVPAGQTGGGQWISGGGGSGRPRVYIYGSNPDDDSAGDGGQSDELVVDGTDWADSNPGFDRATDGSDADDLSADRNDGAINDRASGDRRPTGITDPRVISDADPDVVKPGEEYAQARGGGRSRAGGGGGLPTLNDLNAAETARVNIARSRFEASAERIRQIEPNWKPHIVFIIQMKVSFVPMKPMPGSHRRENEN